MSNIHLIDDQSAWNRAAAELLKLPVMALDTETNNQHAYRSRICLIQIGTPKGELIVDPLAVKDLSLLGRALRESSILKVVHSARNDLSWLDRDFGFTCEPVFDTELAARLLGFSRPNLAALLNHYLDVNIPKSRSVQRSDWAKRPLGPTEIEYAAKDVRFLTSLAVSLKKGLEAAGRLKWAFEEFRRVQQVRYEAVEPPADKFLRLNGSQRLDPRQLAVLRELYALRESEAERRDRPPFHVMSNDTVVTLARHRWQSSGCGQALQAPASQLLEGTGLPPNTPSWLVEEIADAIRRGWSGPEFHRPQTTENNRGRTDEEDNRLRRLKALLAGIGTKLALDPSLLWPTASLERMAMAPGDWRQEVFNNSAADVRQWQRQEFGAALAATCACPDWLAGNAATAPPQP